MADASDPNAQASGNPFASLASALMIPNTPNYVNPAYATPEQRAELYKYAAALMKPEPVHNWAQGLGEVARSIVAGYEGHQADVQEQASQAQAVQDRTNGPGQMIVPSSAADTAPAAPFSSKGGMPADASSYAETDIPSITTRAAQKYGIDPSVATNVFAKESSLNPNAVGDNGTSFNVPQLHVTGNPKHPAMGDQFIAETGLDPRDPKNAPQAIDYALRRASKEGWGAWANTRDKLGYGNFTGIGRAPQGNAMPPNASSFTGQSQIPPAHQAMAAALIGGNPAAAPPASQNYKPMADALIGRQPQAAPMQVAQNGAMPVSPEAYARFMGNPNIPESEKTQFNEQVMPKQFQDANGNVFYSYQNQPVQQQPIATLGHETNIEGVPGVRTGPLNNPRSIIANPSFPNQQRTAPVMSGNGTAAPPATANDSAAAILDPNNPNSAVGGFIKQKQANDALALQKQHVADAYAAEYTQAQKDAAAARDASYPLRQMQGLIESGKMPATGKLAPDLLDYRSIANMFGIGNPDTLAATEEFRKQSGITAQRLAQTLGVHPTDYALSASQGTTPGITLSENANKGLIDNLIRLNDLNQKYAQQKQDWYTSHNGSFDGFQKAWADSIDKTGAIPLSKYPITTKPGPDGKLYDKVPSTARAGFSWFPHGMVQ